MRSILLLVILAACGQVSTHPTPDAPSAAPASLAFGTPVPATAHAHAPIAAFTVEVHDASGHVVTTDNTTTITIDASTGAYSGARPFAGTIMHTVANGIATFDDLQWPFAETVMFDVTATALPSLAHQTIAISQRVYTKLVATSQDINRIATFDLTATGDVAPLTAIAGATTTFVDTWGVSFDEVTGEIVVADFNKNQLDRFPAAATGDVAPTSFLGGATTLLIGPSRPFFDYIHDEIYVGMESGSSVAVHARTATADVPPVRNLAGAATTFNSMDSAVVNYATDEVYATGFGVGTVFVFDRLATGNVAPKRTLTGAATLLGQPFELVAIPEHGELIVGDRGAGVLVFSLDATGNAVPTRHIAGATTTIDGCVSGLAYDANADELYVACQSSPGGIAVFDRTATGDVAPKRLIKGPTTGFTASIDDLVLAP